MFFGLFAKEQFSNLKSSKKLIFKKLYLQTYKKYGRTMTTTLTTINIKFYSIEPSLPPIFCLRYLRQETNNNCIFFLINKLLLNSFNFNFS